jgi:hypothetical protein
MSPRYAARKDQNHDEIADAFRRLGWTFVDTWQCAQYVPGFFDGLACRDGVVIGVEVKHGKEPLTPDEARFHAAWPGRILVARSVEDVLCCVR